MTVSIALDAKLDLKGAERLLGHLAEARGQDISLDCSNVKMLGSQATQVLMSGSQSWKSDGKTYVIQNPSEAMVSDLETMGLSLSELSGGELP